MNKIMILEQNQKPDSVTYLYQDLIVAKTSNPEIFDVIKNRYGSMGWYTFGQLKKFCSENGIWSEKLEGLHPIAPKTIAIEDIATVFASEFVKSTTIKMHDNDFFRIMLCDFLKMNYSRRRKIVSKVLDKIVADSKKD